MKRILLGRLLVLIDLHQIIPQDNWSYFIYTMPAISYSLMVVYMLRYEYRRYYKS